MNEGTISVNTADWLKATRNLRISAYVEESAHAVSDRESALTKEAFKHALRKVSRRAKPSQSDPSRAARHDGSAREPTAV